MMGLEEEEEALESFHTRMLAALFGDHLAAQKRVILATSSLSQGEAFGEVREMSIVHVIEKHARVRRCLPAL
jgi:hypothetical protein